MTLVQTAIQWAINKAISFALEKLQNLIGGNLFGVTLTRLSACVKAVLQPYFPKLNLDRIMIYKGLPWLWAGFASAYTFGNNHYYYRDNFNQQTNAGIALIGHELQHTQQFRQFGTYVFAIRYLSETLRLGYGNDQYESSANLIQGIIRTDLDNQFGGGNPCAAQ